MATSDRPTEGDKQADQEKPDDLIDTEAKADAEVSDDRAADVDPESDAAQTADGDKKADTSPDEDRDLTDDTETAQQEPEVVEDAPREELEPAQEAQSPTETVAPTERIIERKRGGFPALIGGVLAACLGFLSARTEILDPYLPDFLRTEDKTISLSERLDDAQTQLAAARDQIGVLEGQLAEVTASVGDIDETVDAIDIPDVDAALAPIGERIATLEARPIVTPEGAIVESAAFTAMRTSLQALEARAQEQDAEDTARSKEIAETLASVQSLQAEAEKQQAEAAAQQEELQGLLDAAREVEAAAAQAAQAAQARAALAQISSALASGAPYADAVASLEASGLAEVTDDLAAASGDGVATLASLQAGIADAARAALNTARVSSEDANTVGGFLQRQLGVRSVAPKEGSDPDAVLSRLEAAAKAGDLATALAEADALPEVAQEAMAGWLDAARARHAAQMAVDALSQRLSAL